MKKMFLLGIVFMFLLSSIVIAESTLLDDLISYYKFDENTGTTSEDSHGTNDGTITGATWTTGKLNSGLDFGTEAQLRYIDLSTSSKDIGNHIDTLGVSFWISSTYTGSTLSSIMASVNDGAGSLIFNIYITDSNLIIQNRAQDGSNVQLAFTFDISDFLDGDYHHFVINNKWASNDIELYINGNKQTVSSTIINSLTQTASFDYNFIIGARHNRGTPDNSLNGKLDEIAIRETNWLEDEITELYNDENALAYDFTVTDFEITAKDIYTDESINTFNATITNSTDTFTLSTTNGTIIWEYPEEELVNITITATNLFNAVYTNYDVTNNLEAQMFNLVVTAKDRYDDASIDNFSLTYNETTFSTTNGTLRTNLNTPDLNELVSFTISSDDFFDREYENHNVSSNLNAILWNKVNNLVVFKRADNNDNIEDLNVTLTRPDGSQLDLTTNSNGEIQFDFQEDFSVIQGTYSFLIPETFGFLTPVTFFVDVDEDNENIQETYFLSTTSIFVRVFDRTTFDFLEKPTNLFFLEVFNETTSNGTYIQDNVTLGLGTYTVQALSDGYDTEQIEFIYTGVSQIIIDFYMMNLTDESAGTLFVSVIDDFYRVINDAKVNLLEYDTTTKSYIKVSECKTNSNGECSFTIELNKKTYIITAQKDIAGVSNTATTNLGGEIIKTDNEVRNLVLRPSVTGVSFLSQNILLDVEETFENNISTIFMEYSTIDNTIAEMCVEYFEVKSMNRTSVYVQCVNSSSSYSAVPILLNRSNNYEADVYLKSDQNYVFYTFRYQSDQSLQEILSTNNFISPFILLLWIVIIVFMLMTENVTVFVIAGFFLSWLEWLMFPSVVNATGSVLKTMILIFMYYVSRKKEDF